jgi:integrase
MLGLFIGARANAAMTIQYGDLINEEGLDCIYFRSNHEVKNLKNDASERKVPIHKQLLELGFVDYVKRKQKKLGATDKDFIFSHVVTKTGQYNNKYMDRGLFPFLKAIGIKKGNHDGYCFHSLRKNASLIMQTAHIPGSVIDRIVGWEGESTMAQHYSNYSSAELKAQMDTFQYNFLSDYFATWKSILVEKP